MLDKLVEVEHLFYVFDEPIAIVDVDDIGKSCIAVKNDFAELLHVTQDLYCYYVQVSNLLFLIINIKSVLFYFN